jgi:hypothetical protein
LISFHKIIDANSNPIALLTNADLPAILTDTALPPPLTDATQPTIPLAGPPRYFLRARVPNSDGKKGPKKNSKPGAGGGKGKKRAHGGQLSEPAVKREGLRSGVDNLPQDGNADEVKKTAAAKRKGKIPPKARGGKKVASPAKGKGGKKGVAQAKGKGGKKGVAQAKGKSGKKGAASAKGKGGKKPAKGKGGKKGVVSAKKSPKGKGEKKGRLTAEDEKKAAKIAVATFRKTGEGNGAVHGANMFVLFFMDRLRVY